ncbi:MAG: hypothetical protein AAF489_11905 [Bacteroidota bacterium]
MKDETIKQILQENLEEISTPNFNNEIIDKLDIEKSSRPVTVFNTNSVVIVFLVAFLFYALVTFGILENIDSSTLIISMILCFTPLFFMVFNKIGQLALHQK